MPDEAAAPLGQWPNAPLAYVVAELQFPKLVDLDRRLGEIHERLSEQFPLYEVVTIETLMVLPDGSQQAKSADVAHDFRTIDNTIGVRVAASSVQLHAVTYSSWADFAARWKLVLDLAKLVLRPRVLVRAGLRYIDIIVPLDEQVSPTAYLSDALANTALQVPEVGQLEQQGVALNYRQDRIVSRLSLMHLVRGAMALPPSAVPMQLSFSRMQTRALERQRAGHPVSFLDVDVSLQGPQMFEDDKLEALYDDLHVRQSTLFKRSFSARAEKEWKGL